jgi:HAD superfamily hydrolase (TIGR01549 family)
MTRAYAPVFLAFQNDVFRHGIFKVSRRAANCKNTSLIFAAFLVIFFWLFTCDKDAEVVRFSCVIFDLDGTLTQTNPLIFASFNHVAQRYLGRTYSPQEIISWFGPTEDVALAQLLGEQTAAEAMDELCRFYSTHHNEMARLHERVIDVLELLQQRNIRLSLFTGKGERTTRITLEAFGLSRFFDIVVTGDDVVHHKPAPEGIQQIMHRCGAGPEEVLMVGDSLADLQASRSAGVPIAAALWDSYDRTRVLAAQPDVVFHSAEEMLDWFHRHTNGFRRAPTS